MAKSKQQLDLERAHQSIRDQRNLRESDRLTAAQQLKAKDDEIANLHRELANERRMNGTRLSDRDMIDLIGMTASLNAIVARAANSKVSGG